MASHLSPPDGSVTAHLDRYAPRAAAGVDVIHVSGGVHGPQAQDWDGVSEGYHVDIAARIRAAVTAPVIVPGAIRTPAFADRVVREGKADLVAVGAAMLDNPRWAADAIAALA